MNHEEWVWTEGQRRTLAVLRVVFGLIWVLNIWFHLHGAYLDHYLDGYRAAMQGQPGWLQGWIGTVSAGISGIGPRAVALASVALEAFVAFTLLTGRAGRAGAWTGLVYCAFMWSTVGGLGGPITPGYTDPGPWPPYLIGFVLILETRAWQFPRGEAATRWARDPVAIGRLLFGALWAFEAYWKWHPAFLTGFLGYLVPAAHGQPAWIAAYIDAITDVVRMVGPLVVGVVTAVLETLIAASLLSGRLLRYGLVLGALWSMGIWTTAEGWGGPYGHGFSSSPMPGDIFGNAVNYALLFVFLVAVYRNRWRSVPV